MRKTLWRAANDDFVRQGTAFAEERAVAELYLDNPGYGGSTLWKARVSVPEEAVLDLRGVSVRELTRRLGVHNPGAIGLDEWLPQAVRVLDLLAEQGVEWVLVDESYPAGATTWIFVGGEEPELLEVEQ